MLTVEGSRSLRIASRLESQAETAFAQGNHDMGCQLLEEAASLYAREGAHDEAARLRAAIEAPRSLRAGATPMPDLLPGAPVVDAVPASLPRIVGRPVDDEDRPGAGGGPDGSAIQLPVEAPVEAQPPDGGGGPGSASRERAFWRRWWKRLGRSPATCAHEDVEEVLSLARAVGATAFGAQLRRLHGTSGVPTSPPESVDPPGGGSVDLVFDLSSDGGPEEVRLDAASAKIAAAIDELVGDGPSSDLDDSTGEIELRGLEPAETVPSEDLTGVVVRGRFRIERKVGRGSQAQVYLARDQVLDRAVAIKVLAPRLVENPEALEGFLSEARMAAKVHHTGCLSVFDFGREGELTFLAMEFFRGRSLRSLLRGGALEPYLALHLGRHLAEALSSVHQAGIVHRDIKPSNVLVDRAARAKLTDFGVAAYADDPALEKRMVGTLRYMAPEQAAGRGPDPRSDLFSLGAVLWEMLVGRPCFDPTVDALKARMSAPPPPLPDGLEVPAEVKELVVRCLSPQPEARPASAGRLAARLRRGLERLRAQRADGGGTPGGDR